MRLLNLLMKANHSFCCLRLANKTEKVFLNSQTNGKAKIVAPEL